MSWHLVEDIKTHQKKNLSCFDPSPCLHQTPLLEDSARDESVLIFFRGGEDWASSSWIFASYFFRISSYSCRNCSCKRCFFFMYLSVHKCIYDYSLYRSYSKRFVESGIHLFIEPWSSESSCLFSPVFLSFFIFFYDSKKLKRPHLKKT